MADINLLDINKETFGSRLPNVFIEQIEIDYDDGVADVDEDAKIEVYLNIKFTKPPHIQDGSTDTFIEEYLSNLYLYTYLTYFSDVSERLENNNFSILEWMEFSDSVINDDWKSRNHHKILLSDLVPTFVSAGAIPDTEDSGADADGGARHRRAARRRHQDSGRQSDDAARVGDCALRWAV